MLGLLLAVSLAAPSAPPLQLAAPSFTCVNVDEKAGEFFLDALAQQLHKQGARVVGQREIAAVMGLERQKQMLGCGSESASCLAELAGALGVDGIITGSVAKTSSGYAINLKVVASTNAQTLAAQSVRVNSDDALLDWFEGAAVRLVRETRAALGKGKPSEPERPEPQVEQRPAPSETHAPSAERSAGREIEVLWRGKWYPGRLLETRADGRVLISYDGYSATWNEWVSPARVRERGAKDPEPPPPPPSEPKYHARANERVEVKWGSNWYPATVLKRRKDGMVYIQYDGYSESWNEWVPPERVRRRTRRH